MQPLHRMRANEYAALANSRQEPQPGGLLPRAATTAMGLSFNLKRIPVRFHLLLEPGKLNSSRVNERMMLHAVEALNEGELANGIRLYGYEPP